MHPHAADSLVPKSSRERESLPGSRTADEVDQWSRQNLLPQEGKAQPCRTTLVRETLTPTCNSTQSFGLAMLPTPSTSHVAFERVYEPAEDSYLLLDTLSSEVEKAFLQRRFSGTPTASPSPLVVEIGTGSGVVISFVDAHAKTLFGREDVLTIGVDVNRYACKATMQTVKVAEEQAAQGKTRGIYLGNVVGDLASPLRPSVVDVLIINPPYVPTPDLPELPVLSGAEAKPSFEEDSHLLALSYAGGADGMETTDRLLDTLPGILNSDRGCAYILLCAQNRPEDVKQRIRSWGSQWGVETVGSTGKKAGWEKLQIIKIFRT
jgi:release factor glutamine methyltransferase